MVHENRGESTKGGLLYLVHETLASEAIRDIGLKNRIVRWKTTPEIFDDELVIEHASLTYSRDSDMFRVDAFVIGVEGMELKVQKQDPGEHYNNDFSEHVLYKAEQILVHPHELCIEALRERQEAEQSMGTLLSWHRLGQVRTANS